MPLVERHLRRPIQRALATSRIVNLVGPRQVGKTTLVKDLMPAAAFMTLDDPAVRSALTADPVGVLRLARDRAAAAAGPIVIDEVQREPLLALALKQLVDEDPTPGQFLLTGSSDILSSGRAQDSLAGRVATLRLFPLSAAEIAGAGPNALLDALGDGGTLPTPAPLTRDDVIDHLVRGGYPEIRSLPDRDRDLRYESYLDSVIERDAVAVSEVRKPDALRRLIGQVAARTGCELNVSELANALRLKRETLEHYLDILERLGVVARLGAWTSSPAHREIRSPKLHLLDSGCAATLRGEDRTSWGPEGDPAALGPMLESFVFSEIVRSLALQERRWRLYHWRRDQREVDIIAAGPGKRLVLFEVKAAAVISDRTFRHLDWFAEQGPGRGHRCQRVVVYTGPQALPFGEGRVAVPVSVLWSFPHERAL